MQGLTKEGISERYAADEARSGPVRVKSAHQRDAGGPSASAPKLTCPLAARDGGAFGQRQAVLVVCATASAASSSRVVVPSWGSAA